MSWFKRHRNKDRVEGSAYVLGTTLDPTWEPPHPHGSVQETCLDCGAVAFHPRSCPSVGVVKHGARLDDCGICDLTPTVSGYVRGVQVSCPVHGEAKR